MNGASTGSLVGSILGGIIGGIATYGSLPGIMAGASIGGTVGGLAGGLYDTANADGTINKQETIADLRIQTSTLGTTMPQLFGGYDVVDFGYRGANRVAGNIIWATAKVPVEHRETSSAGGKMGGGPEVVNISKTYTISLAIALCDTRVSGAMARIQQAWKNATLVAQYDNAVLPMPANWTFYPGTSTQLPDPTMEAALGVGEVPGYRYTSYLVMTDEDLGPSGQLPQWSFEVGQEGSDTLLTVVVEKLCNAAGLTGAALDVTALPVTTVQMMLTSIEAVRASLEQLAFAYRFYGLESGLTYVWRPVGAGSIVATIPEADGSAGEEKANEHGAQLDRAAPLELPTLQYLTYVDAAQNFQRNTQPSAVVLPPSGKENPKSVASPLVLNPDLARHLSTEIVALSWVQREPYADVLPRKYCYLEPGDKVNFEARGLTYPVVLGATTYGAPGLVDVQGRGNGAPRLGTVATSATTPSDGRLRDATTIPPGAVTPPPAQTLHVPGETTPLLLNLPVLDSSDQPPRYHVAYVGENEPWEGGALYRSVDGEATYQAVDAGALEAITGTVPNALPTVADFTARDDTSVMRVVLEYGSLTTVNDAANAAGVQRAMIGEELVYIGTATLVATREYDCSKLWRGRQGSEWSVALHAANEDFVLIDAAVHKISMTTAERGISYFYKGVSRGQSIADVTSVSFVPVAENLVPWRVTTPVASRPVQDWQLRWYMRSRFVPGGIDPDFIGFQAKIYSSATFLTVLRTINTTGGYVLDGAVLKGLDYSAAQQVADFGSLQTTLYWTVSQVGAYATGRAAQNTSTDLVTVQGAIESTTVPGIVSWIEVTTTTYTMAVGFGYVANNASLVTLTLPATAVLGDVIEVAGKGTGLWRIAQNANQKIHVGRKVTTTGVAGSITVRHAHDACRLVCIVGGASTEWDLVSFA